MQVFGYLGRCHTFGKHLHGFSSLLSVNVAPYIGYIYVLVCTAKSFFATLEEKTIRISVAESKEVQCSLSALVFPQTDKVLRIVRVRDFA